MVTPDEVDDELETETKEECSKYGEVNKCVIHVVGFFIYIFLNYV